MVGIDEVLHHDVVEDLALLLHHLVEDFVGVPAQQEDGEDVDVGEGALVPPGLPDGLPCVKLLVRGADEDDQEGSDAFTLLGLIDDVFEGMWVKGPGADVGEGEVFVRLHSLADGDGHVAHIRVGRGAGYAQVPQSAGPADHGQYVQT